MGMIVVLVFLGVFSVVALLMVATGTNASQQAKKVLATLDSALATESAETRDQIVNLRKTELLSAVPWINRQLMGFQVAPKLRTLLYQANHTLVDLSEAARAIRQLAEYLERNPGAIVRGRSYQKGGE